MQRAIIVKLELNDNDNPQAIAEDIKEILEQEGYVVLGADAWNFSTLNNMVPQMGQLEGEPVRPLPTNPDVPRL